MSNSIAACVRRSLMRICAAAAGGRSGWHPAVPRTGGRRCPEGRAIEGAPGLRGLPTGAVAGVMHQVQQYPGQPARCAACRGATHRAARSRPYAFAARSPTQCRNDVHRAPSARTAMSHGDSAAAHHICALLHHGASRGACRIAPRAARRALRGGAVGAIQADMARRLRKLVRANQWRFVRSTDY
ncbi:hypothetical protein [Burkholderia stabilis]|uniref:hypothetical protein n=1 Tax=Burkholderia stabilis TaxID=95485 RepID=UPI0013CEDB09|nr:hypothetical protein [Burkholderia stabilis]